ncbi:hypothetical protein FVE85_5125 [Porphyridium purpureum]|uniref:Uncharacterized protein n=1 Tax=Porphyridium purpureum TaxID=35688 RepID=A0A5J4Z2M3_PORPP|nr:hypothetical protein FVE85_5125 [Porphyridium purpureum]|eukprot:POR2496..scf295_1
MVRPKCKKPACLMLKHDSGCPTVESDTADANRAAKRVEIAGLHDLKSIFQELSGEDLLHRENIMETKRALTETVKDGGSLLQNARSKVLSNLDQEEKAMGRDKPLVHTISIRMALAVTEMRCWKMRTRTGKELCC